MKKWVVIVFMLVLTTTNNAHAQWVVTNPVWDQTAFIFDKIKSGFINMGIKVMLMSTLASLLIMIISKVRLADNIGYEQMFYYLLCVGAFAYLSKTLPKEVDRLV